MRPVGGAIDSVTCGEGDGWGDDRWVAIDILMLVWETVNSRGHCL